MRTLRYDSIGAVALAAAFFIGCSKSPSSQIKQQSGAKSEAFAKMFPHGVPTNWLSTKKTYLGRLELSTNAPSNLSIDATNDCTITTTALPDGNLRLDITVETRASVPQPVHAQMIVRPGQQFAFRVIGMSRMVSYTAELKAE